MTTITINEKTKAGKSFLEFAKNLPFVKVNEANGLGKPAVALKPKIAKISETQRRKNILAFTKTLDTKKPIKISITDAEIVEECRIVRQKRYDNAK